MEGERGAGIGWMLLQLILTAGALIAAIAALRYAIADLSLGYATTAAQTFVLCVMGRHM